MICPKDNRISCNGIDCPMFCLPADSCLEVLALKDKLNILSAKEKQALAVARRESQGLGQ